MNYKKIIKKLIGKKISTKITLYNKLNRNNKSLTGIVKYICKTKLYRK